MPSYEAGAFNPPAAVVRAIVSGPGSTVYPNVPFLIDSGADVSVVPISVAVAVGAVIEPSTTRILSFTGDEIASGQAELSLEFLGKRFRGQYLITEADHGIIGRNILNMLVLNLDGPRLAWTLVRSGGPTG